MPPLPGTWATAPQPSPFMVPVINSSGRVSSGKGKALARDPPRRQYGDEPLPVKPKDIAPRNARIIGREQAHDGGLVGYHLQIGDVEINDVGVDEILDYVSPLQLEQFEVVRFREEAEILKVLEQDREAERKAKLVKAAEKARNRGAVFGEENSDSEALAALAEPDEVVETGKHGRARPNYSRFYKPARGKGKEIFQDAVDDPMEISDPEPSASRPAGNAVEKHRRRRRRDPVTGELMPLPELPAPKLEVEKGVRRRRKRHPLTGELMPLGWKYDPDEERQSYEIRRDGLGSLPKGPSFKRLSISEQHQAKRPRLNTESDTSRFVSPVPTKAEIMGRAALESTPRGGALKASIVDLMSTDDEQKASTPRSTTKLPAKQAGNSMVKGTVASRATTSPEESSPEPVMVSASIAKSPSASQHIPKAPQTATSIMSPSAARASLSDPLAPGAEDSSSDGEEEEDEWFIESILGHRMSDPRTHPPELGKEPVMLYSVKWEGFDKPTWEPRDSFGDRSFVDEYREKVGLKPLPKDNSDDEEDTIQLPSAGKQRNAAPASGNNSLADAEEDEDEYELERIVTHHLSDPRTHPKALGKTPVMLYQVKWKGWEEMTWEPEESFEDDMAPLSAYKNKHGLK